MDDNGKAANRGIKGLVVVAIFLIANLWALSGTETLDGHLLAITALVLLGTVAVWSAVLVVMRIRAGRRSKAAP